MILTRVPDSEGDNNRGWIVHKVSAVTPYMGTKKEIGYLKISYIPEDRFENHYKSVIDYILNIQGYSCNRKYYESKRDWIASLAYTFYHKSWVGPGNWVGWHNANRLMDYIHSAPDSHLDYILDKIRRDVNKVYSRNFREFRNTYVNYPIVDYISVDKEFRRLGLGTELYIAGGKWMKELGMALHSSTCQQEKAAAVWNSMLMKGIAKPSKFRKVDRTRFCKGERLEIV